MINHKHINQSTELIIFNIFINMMMVKDLQNIKFLMIKQMKKNKKNMKQLIIVKLIKLLMILKKI